MTPYLIRPPRSRRLSKKRQLMTIQRLLEHRGYSLAETAWRLGVDPMRPGTFALLLHMPVVPVGRTSQKTIPIDVAVMPAGAPPGDLPLLIVARVAGDA